MKLKIKKVFLLMVGLTIFACSDDDGGIRINEGIEFSGTWVLTEVNVSTFIDVNNDGTTSNDLLDEVDCLTDTIVLDDTFEWNSTEVVSTFITQITNDLYNVNCSEERTQNGNWGVSGTNLFLIGSVNRTFLISNDRLIENIGQDIPGIRTMVYTRQ